MERVCTSRFLLSSFSASHSLYPINHFCDARNGKEKTTISYITKGSVIISTAGEEIKAEAGDIIYQPDGIKYTSSWKGDPDVEYYSIHFDFLHLRETRIDRTFALQSISNGKDPCIGDLIVKIFENYEKEGSDRLLSLSDFYLLWSKILPLLDESKKIIFSSAVTSALEYIEKEYLSNFSVAELASHCHLSESRLYHKFSDEMKCSPIHYRNKLRIRKAIEYLKDGNYSVSEISDKLNFNSPVYFRKIFKQLTGFSPAEYKKLRREQN